MKFLVFCRRTSEFREQASCYRDGRSTRAGEDLHIEEIMSLPELDRDKHEGVQSRRVQEARNIGVQVSRLLSSGQHKGDGDKDPVRLRRATRRLHLARERGRRGRSFRRDQFDRRSSTDDPRLRRQENRL